MTTPPSQDNTSNTLKTHSSILSVEPVVSKQNTANSLHSEKDVNKTDGVVSDELEMQLLRIPNMHPLAVPYVINLITQQTTAAEKRGRIDELERLIGTGAAGDKYRTKAAHGFMTIEMRLSQLQKGDKV